MNKKTRRILTAVFIIVLAVSLICMAVISWQERESSRDYEEAAQITAASEETNMSVPAVTPDMAAEHTPRPVRVNVYTDSEIDELRTMDIEALREVNEDVIGWIRIPDTAIDYPLLRGSDNEYYLEYNWKNKASAVGAIFIEHGNAADFSDFNTIIYGHNMRSGSMFGGLKKFRSQSYWEEHPYVYILHDNGVSRYDIFAAHKVNQKTIMYGMQITKAEQQEEFIRFALDYSDIDTGIEPTIEDSILTLSTCSGNSSMRWIIQGVLNEEQSYYKDLS